MLESTHRLITSGLLQQTLDEADNREKCVRSAIRFKDLSQEVLLELLGSARGTLDKVSLKRALGKDKRAYAKVFTHSFNMALEEK
eukprot:5247050-Prorocentrum_lima.AAC.1